MLSILDIRIGGFVCQLLCCIEDMFMGQAKKEWMEKQDEEYWEEKCKWIREQLEDEEADEFTQGWDALAEEFNSMHEHDDSDDYRYEDQWSVAGKTRFEIFDETINAAKNILNITLPPSSNKSLLIMLYGHVVAAIESYLSSTFIEISLSTENHMRRLVESDPEFAKRKFTIKEIFVKREELKDDLKKYLKKLIFHDIAKVKPMYISVLDIDFGDVKWLFEAVALRHHCVHRAGYDKEGSQIAITKATVSELIEKATTMVGDTESTILSMPSDGDFFWKT